DAYAPQFQWKTQRYLAIDQGTIGPMIENHKTQLFWNLFMNAPEIRSGLVTLGFTSTQHGF
ncbi:beta-glucosidase, partial [Flavobacteriaceae bacterium]|nr:beta-glucosidase [Flavobacteriaceae bacterium]